jgi:hypothetical protein
LPVENEFYTFNVQNELLVVLVIAVGSFSVLTQYTSDIIYKYHSPTMVQATYQSILLCYGKRHHSFIHNTLGIYLRESKHNTGVFAENQQYNIR